MPDAGTRIEPFFLPSPRGPLFCIFHAPAGEASRGGVLYLHPFAEEMHKSRRMAALQARALARRGYSVLQIDLTGCGDSAGDFGDATWEAWLDDARLGHARLAQACAGPIGLWGLRTGALLAAEAAASLAADRLVLWQPVVDGALFLNQFLRIKVASEMLRNGQAQTGTRALLDQLARGEGIEVGGNLLAPAMAEALGRRNLANLTPHCPVFWLEAGAEAALAPAGQGVLDAWQARGTAVRTRTVCGQPFWISQEITECPELIEATLACFPD